MRKPGKGGKVRDAYFWNDYTDDQDKKFFKIVVGDFRKRLVLPEKLAVHFRGKITKRIKLESRSGHTFDVQVATSSLGRLALQSGWELFVSAHDLKMLDFLVFKYDGISQMKVLTFDASGCEKEPPCFVTRNAIDGTQSKDESIDISSNYSNIPMKTPETKKKPWKQRDRSKVVNTVSSSSSSESSGGSTSSQEHEVHSVPSYILPQRTSLTNVQKKKLKEKVGTICSEIPIYVCVMKKSNISGNYKNMCFSGEYSDEYLPFKKGKVMLHHHGKSWEVMCRVQVRTGHSKFQKLCKGWARFACDNSLQLGDLCLFELLDTKKYMMKVHIVREK